MTYLELSFVVPEDEVVAEVFCAQLGELGFDSFLQEENNLKAYITDELFVKEAVIDLLKDDLLKPIQWVSTEPMPDKNWNEVWESSYNPVIINEKCRIRAPFHEPDAAFEFDLLIEPRMSFGTAHHETTAQMLEWALQTDFKGKSTLDMGCGTAVLAILAHKLGATPVVAIDNDEWAFNNSIDNISLNATGNISVELGDAINIGDRKFDVILANINRNILLADIPVYAKALYKDGILILSGFYTEDLPIIKEKAEANLLFYKQHTSKNNWVAAVFNA